MNTLIPKLDPIFEEPQDGSQVTGEMVKLSTEEISVILTQMGFERQRDADKDHIGMLADMFSNGEFAPGSQITFAIDGYGVPKLVDGQHRLRAAVQAHWEGYWNVRAVWGSAHNAEGVYTLLDAHQKKRPAAVIGRALGLIGLSERTIGTAVAASRYQNEWDTEYSLPGGCKYPPVRDNISRVKKRLPYYVQADELLNAGNVSSQAKRKLVAAMVLAVIVETLAHDQDGDARVFWTSVATNGDGIAGELRDGLIAGKPAKARQFYNPRLAAAAWNQRHSSAKLRKENQKNILVSTATLEIPA